MATPLTTVTTQALSSHLAQVFAQYPIEVAHGEGVWLHTRDGRKILDFYGGHAVAGLGYGHPRWLAALSTQARQMAFQTNAVHVGIRERAAARLAKFVGLGLDTVFWINSGAEANENALKLAFKITGRGKAVALEQGWHGRTAAAGAVTWGAVGKWYGFPHTPFDVSFAPRNNPAAVERFVDADTAAVIVEPVQGVGGAYDVGKPMLQGPDGRPLRSELLRRDARHPHGGQGAGQRISGLGAADVAAGGGSDQIRRHGHHVRRRAHGLRGRRSRDRYHRIGVAAGERPSGLDLHPVELRH